MVVERKLEVGGEVANEGEVGVSFRAAQAVVEVGDVEDEAAGGRFGVEGAEEGYGVRSARHSDGEAQAGREELPGEREERLGREGHELMIARRQEVSGSWFFAGLLILREDR